MSCLDQIPEKNTWLPSQKEQYQFCIPGFSASEYKIKFTNKSTMVSVVVTHIFFCVHLLHKYHTPSFLTSYLLVSSGRQAHLFIQKYTCK